MLTAFSGSAELYNGYEAALFDTEADLVIIRDAVGFLAVEELRKIGDMPDVEVRTRSFQELLYNELPDLEDAERQIEVWASEHTLPDSLVAVPKLEGPVHKRVSPAVPHFDYATAPSDVIIGPFAMSIGTRGDRLFRSLRFTRDLTDGELLGIDPYPLNDFVKAWVDDNGKFRTEVATTTQRPGDMILIPGTPRPALHSVELDSDSNATSIISSYVMTQHQEVTPAGLRRLALASSSREQRFVLRNLRQLGLVR